MRWPVATPLHRGGRAPRLGRRGRRGRRGEGVVSLVPFRSVPSGRLQDDASSQDASLRMPLSGCRLRRIPRSFVRMTRATESEGRCAALRISLLGAVLSTTIDHRPLSHPILSQSCPNPFPGFARPPILPAGVRSSRRRADPSTCSSPRSSCRRSRSDRRS